MLVVALIVLVGIFTVDKAQDYSYVGYHECSQIGYVESDILFKKGYIPSSVCAKKEW